MHTLERLLQFSGFNELFVVCCAVLCCYSHSDEKNFQQVFCDHINFIINFLSLFGSRAPILLYSKHTDTLTLNFYSVSILFRLVCCLSVLCVLGFGTLLLLLVLWPERFGEKTEPNSHVYDISYIV